MRRRANQSYTGRRPCIWLRVLIALVLAGAVAFSALLGAVLWGSRDQIQGEPQVMIVLGCKVEEQGPSVLLRDRLEEALDYWEEHPGLTIVVSGGQGPNEPTTEARAMADYLIDAGVPEEQLLLEDQSHNTDQNLRYTMALLEEEDLEPGEGVVIVSNGFHLARARLLAERAGFEQVSTLAAPSSHLPSLLYMYIREPMALVKSFLLDR